MLPTTLQQHSTSSIWTTCSTASIHMTLRSTPLMVALAPGHLASLVLASTLPEQVLQRSHHNAAILQGLAIQRSSTLRGKASQSLNTLSGRLILPAKCPTSLTAD